MWDTIVQKKENIPFIYRENKHKIRLTSIKI